MRGVGPEVARKLRAREIRTARDLALTYPRTYKDWRQPTAIGDLIRNAMAGGSADDETSEEIAVGTVTSLREYRARIADHFGRARRRNRQPQGDLVRAARIRRKIERGRPVVRARKGSAAARPAWNRRGNDRAASPRARSGRTVRGAHCAHLSGDQGRPVAHPGLGDRAQPRYAGRFDSQCVACVDRTPARLSHAAFGLARGPRTAIARAGGSGTRAFDIRRVLRAGVSRRAQARATQRGGRRGTNRGRTGSRFTTRDDRRLRADRRAAPRHRRHLCRLNALGTDEPVAARRRRQRENVGSRRRHIGRGAGRRAERADGTTRNLGGPAHCQTRAALALLRRHGRRRRR